MPWPMFCSVVANRPENVGNCELEQTGSPINAVIDLPIADEIVQVRFGANAL